MIWILSTAASGDTGSSWKTEQIRVHYQTSEVEEDLWRRGIITSHDGIFIWGFSIRGVTTCHTLSCIWDCVVFSLHSHNNRKRGLFSFLLLKIDVLPLHHSDLLLLLCHLLVQHPHPEKPEKTRWVNKHLLCFLFLSQVSFNMDCFKTQNMITFLFIKKTNFFSGIGFSELPLWSHSFILRAHLVLTCWTLLRCLFFQVFFDGCHGLEPFPFLHDVLHCG